MRSARKTLAALLLAASLFAPAAAAQPAPSRSDSLLLVIANNLLRGRTEANEGWPAEWFRGEFMLLRPEGGALAVFNGSPPVALGLPLATHQLNDSSFAHVYGPGTPGIPTRFEIPSYDGRHVVAWPPVDSIYNMSDPVLANVFAVYHEAFHAYQFDTGWIRSVPLDGVNPIPRELVVAPEFQDMAARERELLTRALYLTNADSTRALLRTYLDLRATRTALLPLELRQTEAYEERKEASAQLVAYRAALLAVEGSANDMVPLIASHLRNTPPFDAPYGALGSFRLWHIYATGSAIGVLLDRLRVPWKRELEQGATFVELLARAVAR
jgi:hypothetical protein